MSRVAMTDPNTATSHARALLDAVQRQLGATPNFIRVRATSPRAPEGFLGLYSCLGASSREEATQAEIDFPGVALARRPGRGLRRLA